MSMINQASMAVENVTVTDEDLAQMRAAFVNAHPNTQDVDRQFIHALLTICNRAANDPAAGMVCAYPEQADFARLVLSHLARDGELRETKDAENHTRFTLTMENKIPRMLGFTNQIAIRTKSGDIIESLHGGRNGAMRRVPMYEELKCLCDFQKLLAENRQLDGSIRITPEAYAPYLDGLGAKSWANHLHHTFLDTIREPIALDAAGNLNLSAESADYLHSWNSHLCYYRGVDTGREFTIMLHGYGREVALTAGYPQLRGLLMGVNGIVGQPGKNHTTEFSAIGMSGKQVRDAFAALCPNIAQRSVEDSKFVLPKAIADKVCKEFKAVSKELNTHGATAAEAKIKTIRVAYPVKEETPEKPRPEKPQKPTTVITTSSAVNAEMAQEDALQMYMQPLAAFGHLIEYGSRLRAATDGKTALNRPSEAVRKIVFPSEIDAQRAYERISRLFGHSTDSVRHDISGQHFVALNVPVGVDNHDRDHMAIQRDPVNKRHYWLVVPEALNSQMHKKISGYMDRLEAIEHAYATDRPKADALRDTLVEELRDMRLVGDENGKARPPRVSSAPDATVVR